MAYGIIGYSQANKLFQPSGAIWGDCLSQEMLDEGTGFFNFQDFKAGLPLTTAPNWNIDSGTFTYNSHYDSVVSVTTGSTTLDDAGIATRPLGPITSGSGQKIWFETEVSLASISAVNGLFVGLVNVNALGSKLLISVSSATLASNVLGTSSGHQSGYGFWLNPATPTNMDAVWFNNITTGLSPTSATTTANAINNQQPTGTGTDATGAGTVLASVLTANANNPNPGNLGFVPATPPGVLIATQNTAAVTTSPISPTPSQVNLFAQDPSTNPQVGLPNSATGATGFVKLGLRYDGQGFLYYYVNGAQVAKLAITSSMDQISDFAGVIDFQALGSGAPVLNVAFMRAAALLVP